MDNYTLYESAKHRLQFSWRQWVYLHRPQQFIWNHVECDGYGIFTYLWWIWGKNHYYRDHRFYRTDFRQPRLRVSYFTFSWVIRLLDWVAAEMCYISFNEVYCSKNSILLQLNLRGLDIVSGKLKQLENFLTGWTLCIWFALDPLNSKKATCRAPKGLILHSLLFFLSANNLGKTTSWHKSQSFVSLPPSWIPPASLAQLK